MNKKRKIKNIQTKPTFEESLSVIDEQIERRRSKWNVHISYIDFDDIKQLLLIHIFKKWGQFDPKKGELSHWISSICSAQIKNHWRNLLGNTISPCEMCVANEGGDKCRIYGIKDATQCNLLAKWEKTKKQKYNLRLAANIDDFHNTLYYTAEKKDYNGALIKITELLKKELSKKQFRIYTMIYLEHLSDEEISKQLGYKSSEKRKAGYAAILLNKKLIIAKIKEIIREHDII